MRKLAAFMMVSLDGFFEGKKGADDHDLSWHNVDPEFNDFAVRQLDAADTLLFGRRTYELMASFWPSERARKISSATAERMNAMKKIVFSRTDEKADWQNTRLIHKNVEEEITNLKKQPGKDLLILGSSNLCVSLIEMGLIDEFRLMVNPVVIGAGTALFAGIKSDLKLELMMTKTFKSGNVLLTYQKVGV